MSTNMCSSRACVKVVTHTSHVITSPPPQILETPRYCLSLSVIWPTSEDSLDFALHYTLHSMDWSKISNFTLPSWMSHTQPPPLSQIHLLKWWSHKWKFLQNKTTLMSLPQSADPTTIIVYVHGPGILICWLFQWHNTAWIVLECTIDKPCFNNYNCVAYSLLS